MTKKRGWRVPLMMLTVVGLMLAIGGTALWFAATRLDIADQWGSVAGGVAAVLGLPLSVYGIMLNRKAGESGAVHQSIQAGRDAYVAGQDQHFGHRN